MCLMAIQHLTLNVIDSGSGTDTFFIIMMNIQSLSDAALSSSHGTSAYETGINNPYEYFQGLGIDLQDFSVRFLRKPNANGSMVTGVFNICGIRYTAGASDFNALLQSVIRQYREKCEYHRLCRETKRMRNTLSFIDRHPDATILPVWLM